MSKPNLTDPVLSKPVLVHLALTYNQMTRKLFNLTVEDTSLPDDPTEQYNQGLRLIHL